jgi:hypothetical protein
MRLIVNGYDIELDPNVAIARTLQVNDIGSVATRQASYTNTFNLPKTAKNTKAFQMLGIVGNNSNVPYQKNECYLYSDSGESIVYKGWALITSTDKEFKCNIYDGVIDLFKAIENKNLSDLDLSEVNHTKTLTTVVNSFSSNLNYRYILADYNGKARVGTSLNIDYLIPSVKVSYLLSKIEQYTGFTFNGSFKNLNDFKDLWLTYPKGVPSTSGVVVFNSTDLSSEETRFDDQAFIRYRMIIGTHTQTGFVVSPDGKSITATENISINATIKINPNILIDVTNVGFFSYYPTANFEGNVFTCDGTEREFIIPLELAAGQTKTFDINVFFDTQYDITAQSVNSQNDAFINVKFEKALAISFSDEFKNLKIKDFINEIMQRFCLTAYKDKYTNVYQFKRLNEVFNANSIDWSDKFQENTSEEYKLSYAQLNWLRYKYNDDSADYNDGFFAINNVNLPEKTTVINSFAYSPEREFSNSLGLTTPTRVYKFWNKEVKDNGSVEYKGLNNRFYFLKHTNVTFESPISVTSDLLGGSQSITSAPVESYNGLSFSDTVDNYYPELTKILNKTKVQSLIMRLNERDVLNFDFSKPIYIKQLGGNFLVNKILNFIPFQNTKVEVIRIGEL